MSPGMTCTSCARAVPEVSRFCPHWLDPVSILLLARVVLFSLTRFALLATTVLFASQNALDFCISQNLFAWYGAGTILAVLWVSAAAGYGFYRSFAGRLLLRASLLQE